MALIKKPTQCDRIKRYVRDNGYINFMIASHQLGISQLASRIFELEHEGEMYFERIRRKGKTAYGDTFDYVDYVLECDNG